MGALADFKAEVGRLEPTRRNLRSFGLVMLAALGLIGGWLWWQESPYYQWLLAPGIILGLWGLLWPSGMKPLYLAWMTLALVMGQIRNRVLLTAIFYLVVTPLGLVLKALGKDLLGLRTTSPSYWKYRTREPYQPGRSEKMY